MIKPSGRVSHISFLVRRENLQKYVDHFSSVLGIDTWDGPKDIPELNLSNATSLEAGILLVAPLNDKFPLAKQLEKNGEGFIGFGFGTETLEDAVERAQASEATVFDTDGEVIHDMMVAINGGPMHDSWNQKFSMVREAMIEGPLGMNFIVLVQIEPRDEQS